MNSTTTVAHEVTVPFRKELPPVPGFSGSPFSSLVVSAVDQCLGQLMPEQRVLMGGDGTGILLASVSGDTATAETVGSQMVERRQISPLLFHQSVPNPVLSLVAKKYGITGAISCLSVPDAVEREARLVAETMVGDGDVDRVLVLVVGADGATAYVLSGGVGEQSRKGLEEEC
ncbi:hypothetical protein [Streptomyces tanashiensis]|uniref:hypothetical protein n=1 Tax=Streptomyces tanashiensis TaxID=67367 RepID=UPI00340097EA